MRGGFPPRCGQDHLVFLEEMAHVEFLRAKLVADLRDGFPEVRALRQLFGLSDPEDSVHVTARGKLRRRIVEAQEQGGSRYSVSSIAAFNFQSSAARRRYAFVMQSGTSVRR